MNTPAHSILSLVVLDRGRLKGHELPILAGSLLPDAPMVLFYLYEKIIRGSPENVIWGERYFEASWQTFFDLFNSIPLAALVVLAAWRARAWGWVAFGASVILHCLTDLPLHNDDAHRHFFPFSNWRFESPLSYWDPAHHGHYFALLEIVGVALGCVALYRRYERRSARILVGLVALAYFLYLAFVIVVWL